MASEEKKYSLISVDTGAAEEETGVRTSREVVDGEETIVVSSNASPREAQEAAASGTPRRSQADHAHAETRPDLIDDADLVAQDDGSDDNDQIPFQRMQGIIIVCLIVLIVVFLVYFNFIR